MRDNRTLAIGAGVAALVLLVLLIAGLSANNRQYKIDNASGRVEELVRVCQTAALQLIANQGSIQEQWRQRKIQLAPGRTVGDMHFDPRNAQTISVVCGRVTELKLRLLRVSDKKGNEHDDELVAVYDLADVDGVNDAVNSAGSDMTAAELAVGAVQSAEYRLSSVQNTVDNMSSVAVDPAGARSDMVLARFEVSSGWADVAIGSWAMAESAANSADSYLNSAVSKASRSTPTPMPQPTSVPRQVNTNNDNSSLFDQPEATAAPSCWSCDNGSTYEPTAEPDNPFSWGSTDDAESTAEPVDPF